MRFSTYKYVSMSVRTTLFAHQTHTFHGLFNSKPAGATGLSDCPLKYPVNRLSRSITISGQYIAKFEDVKVVLCCTRVSRHCTLLVVESILTLSHESIPHL